MTLSGNGITADVVRLGEVTLRQGGRCKRDTDTQGSRPGMAEADAQCCSCSRGMPGCPRPPAAGKGKEGSSPTGLRGRVALPTPPFQTAAASRAETMTSAAVSIGETCSSCRKLMRWPVPVTQAWGLQSAHQLRLQLAARPAGAGPACTRLPHRPLAHLILGQR